MAAHRAQNFIAARRVVDGGEGGYTMAAREMKRRVAGRETSAAVTSAVEALS